MWFLASFDDDVWNERVRAAVRLLADTGVGGGRSRGWGRSLKPEFRTVEMPEFLLGDVTVDGGESGWWLLSLFSPSDSDAVDWGRGNYASTVRSGRVQDSGDLKPAARMVSEGSVLLSGAPPAGTARNVAPAEHAHPVYRSGIALAVQIPWQEGQRFTLAFEKERVAEAAPARVAPPELPPEESEATEIPEAEESAVVALLAAGPQPAGLIEAGPVIEAIPPPETEVEAAPEPAPEPAVAEPATDAGVSGTPATPTPPDESPVEEPPAPTEPPRDEPPGRGEPPIGEPGPEPPPEKAQ
jgi:hypothetical protein